VYRFSSNRSGYTDTATSALPTAISFIQYSIQEKALEASKFRSRTYRLLGLKRGRNQIYGAVARVHLCCSSYFDTEPTCNKKKSFSNFPSNFESQPHTHRHICVYLISNFFQFSVKATATATGTAIQSKPYMHVINTSHFQLLPDLSHSHSHNNAVTAIFACNKHNSFSTS
jgi:hypothetical protein